MSNCTNEYQSSCPTNWVGVADIDCDQCGRERSNRIHGGQRIAIDPKVASLVKQASSALKGKQHDLAISCLTAALQMKPEKNTASAIYTWRADAYIQKGELNKAMDDANESIRLNPHFSGGYLERGIVYRRTGNLDKSICDYSRPRRRRS
jgi:tetratricopeptide (TPR) repeat protein